MNEPYAIPCPDPECEAGTIVVHNAYAADPLKGEKQPCDRCGGAGVVMVDDEVATD